ncbi:MAG: AraC family transcriptional regulator [Clostridiales bacterium]|nr:AraC family transcriptional regulator [Clostridiales bacterium]
MRKNELIFLANKNEEQHKTESYLSVRKKYEPLRPELQKNLHWHDYYELEFIYGGSGTHIISGMQYPLKRGCLYLLVPTDFHSVRENPSDTLKLYNLNFNELILPSAMISEINDICGTLAVELSEAETVACEQLFEQLINEYENLRSDRDIMLRSLTSQICVLALRSFYQNHPRISSTSSSDQPVQTAISYIRANFRNNITLTQLAELVHLTPNYLGELFSSSVGMSFSSYLRKLRFDYAVNLLTSSSLTVEEISSDAGFCTPSYFIAMFKENFDTTPARFRRDLQAKKR